MFDIEDNLKKLPDSPGVYIHKDKLGNIIYVGKAISLRKRVRQYFRASSAPDPRIRSMVSQIAEFEYITVGSEVEALILECNLIKKHRPKYNILLRDDKTYPYIKVTNEEYPRVLKTRLVKKDGSHYFGPYSDAGAVNRIVDLLNSAFSLKRCAASSFPEGYKPCLNYHINECKGICSGEVSPDEYDAAVSGALEFLRGHTEPIISELKEKMRVASETMEYEEAAACRDNIEAVKTLSEMQRVVLHSGDEADVILPCLTESGSYIVVFSVRDGKLIGRETYQMDGNLSADTESELVMEFIKQHYIGMPNIPGEILVSHKLSEAELLEKYLSEIAGHKVKILRPERGKKRALVQLAFGDVTEMVKTIDDRAEAAREREEALGWEIWSLLEEMEPGYEAGKYDGRKFRVEAYDISNTNGIDTVGGMVVFEGLKPDRKSYRKFKIRNVEGPDDYASMREVLSRRFLRVFNKSGEAAFSVLPDIILMDGGKGHVNAALEVIKPTGFHIPVMGMVKDDKHRTRALVYHGRRSEEEFFELPLAKKPLLQKYIGRIQEEVHRFTIDYHRNLRGRSIQKSVLDEIKGIGPVRRKALLEEFGSVDAIRKAATEGTVAESVDCLAQVPGMNRSAAENVSEYFRYKPVAK